MSRRRHLTQVLATLVALLALTQTQTPQARTTAQYPEVWTIVSRPRPSIVISMDRHGQIRVSDGEEMSLPISDFNELNPFLNNVWAKRPDLPITLYIDKRARYKHVEPLFAELATLGVTKVYLFVHQRTKPIDPELRKFIKTVTGHQQSNSSLLTSGVRRLESLDGCRR